MTFGLFDSLRSISGGKLADFVIFPPGFDLFQDDIHYMGNIRMFLDKTPSCFPHALDKHDCLLLTISAINLIIRQHSVLGLSNASFLTIVLACHHSVACAVFFFLLNNILPARSGLLAGAGAIILGATLDRSVEDVVILEALTNAKAGKPWLTLSTQLLFHYAHPLPPKRTFPPTKAFQEAIELRNHFRAPEKLITRAEDSHIPLGWYEEEEICVSTKTIESYSLITLEDIVGALKTWREKSLRDQKEIINLKFNLKRLHIIIFEVEKDENRLVLLGKRDKKEDILDKVKQRIVS
ncbi:hypothetical protein DFJ58DRAFT_916879 [Suillus subalutaceus]|uniref:uncharacterized protein n=1 Tax=Suillus subalutaceus TaxID=48586 RepID=UPI001B87A143|nr:uncharacterized protein DFJ58DRAFT_916879 [Suillus subalutaceus]KAG1839815.1 hypothetical protein DFJ58DRAFT_916879 [Suillus subalutaceus]